MRIYKLSTLLLTFLLIGACSNLNQPKKEGHVLPGTRTAVNDIYVREGKPAVRYNTVVLKNGQRIVFAGPDEFRIVFKNESLFEDASDNEPGDYRSRDGIIILRVSDEKTARLKDGTVFKYSVFVNGVELDPFIRWVKDN